MLSIIHSRARLGLQAPLVTIEVHLSPGLPGFLLVGLAETTVRVLLKPYTGIWHLYKTYT